MPYLGHPYLDALVSYIIDKLRKADYPLRLPITHNNIINDFIIKSINDLEDSYYPAQFIQQTKTFHSD